MAIIVSEASAYDLLESVGDDGRPRAIHLRRALGYYARQVAGGAAVTVRDPAGRLCLVAGLYPGEAGDEAEAWFAAGPALRAHFRDSIRAAREVLETIGAEAGQLAARAYIHPDSVAGGRIAAWFGFERVEDTPVGRVRLQTWQRRFG